ncbi:MAG: GGDEF domain-containing protein [Patulibacter minatonensis]
MLGSKRTHELVPLDERARLLEYFRVAMALAIVIAWLVVPASRGTSLPTLLLAAAGYLVALGAVQRTVQRLALPIALFFGISVMLDGAALIWASLGVAGIESPLVHLLLVQVIVVSLIGSFRLGLKLALFQVWLVLGAVYLQEMGLFSMHQAPIHFGSAAFLEVMVEVVSILAVAAVTTGFAAVNERELRRRRTDVEDLAELTMRLEEADGAPEIARRLLEGIEALHGCSRGVVVRRTKGGALTLMAGRGVAFANAFEAVDPEQAPLVKAVVEGGSDVLVVHRADDGDALLLRFPDGARLAMVPLPIDAAGGTIIVEHPADAGARMRQRTLSLIGRYAAHAAIVMRNAELLQEVRALATTDGLTGLPNRRHLDDALDRACAQVARGHGSLGVLMLDVDKFKVLNDTHGHAVGDQVLQHVAKVLDGELRAGDMVARYGGEEFTVVMPGADGFEVQGAAERLRCAIELSGGPVPVTVSVGVAYAPAHGFTREALLSAADGALYEAKRAGRNRVAVAPDSSFEPEVLDARAV